jgi:galactokinase/mevalonate kinase-like predicted kinase
MIITRSPLRISLGGEGFLMFLAEDMSRMRRAICEERMEELRFKLDFDSSKVLFS